MKTKLKKGKAKKETMVVPIAVQMPFEETLRRICTRDHILASATTILQDRDVINTTHTSKSMFDCNVSFDDALMNLALL